MNKNPVGWFEIYVDDVELAKAFYSAVLGVEFTKLSANGQDLWAFPMFSDGGGATGALIHMNGFKAGGNSVLVYFVCDDCAVEAGKAVAAGGTIQREKFAIGPYGFIAVAIDTEGNMFGLHSMK